MGDAARGAYPRAGLRGTAAGRCAWLHDPAGNLLHFLDHTWEFCRLGLRAGKPKTTFWPPGTPPSTIADELGRALDGNPAGGHARPIPGAGGEPWGTVHVGTVNAPGGPRIGMFYPIVGETIMPDIMQALIALLGP